MGKSKPRRGAGWYVRKAASFVCILFLVAGLVSSAISIQLTFTDRSVLFGDANELTVLQLGIAVAANLLIGGYSVRSIRYIWGRSAMPNWLHWGAMTVVIAVAIVFAQWFVGTMGIADLGSRAFIALYTTTQFTLAAPLGGLLNPSRPQQKSD